MKYLDLNIRILSELNEINFCSLFTVRIRLNKDADIFYNEIIENDYFFNRVNLIQNIVETNEVIEIVKCLNEKRKVDRNDRKYFLYLPSELLRNKENIMKNRNRIDKIISLKSPKKLKMKSQSKEYSRKMILNTSFEKGNISNWIKLFCDIFDVCVLKKVLKKIIVNHRDKLIPITLLWKTKNGLKTKPVGCGMMFDDGYSIAMYCLGTLPKYRNKCIGKHILNFGLSIAKLRGYRYFTLQTFENDGILNYYTNLGFTVINIRDIYVI